MSSATTHKAIATKRKKQSSINMKRKDDPTQLHSESDRKMSPKTKQRQVSLSPTEQFQHDDTYRDDDSEVRTELFAFFFFPLVLYKYSKILSFPSFAFFLLQTPRASNEGDNDDGEEMCFKIPEDNGKLSTKTSLSPTAKTTRTWTTRTWTAR